ncbi:MAG: S8 family serine peptidase [Oligoflexia bacterium]|nr:S8 family serine peptidase [Oligoflexia bacterium]
MDTPLREDKINMQISNFRILLLIILNIHLTTSTFAHTLEESITMFKNGYVQEKILLIKFKDILNSNIFGKSAPINKSQFKLNTSISYKVEPVFLSGKKRYPNVPSHFAKTIKPPNLENYYYYYFTQAPTQDQAKALLESLYADHNIAYAYFEPELFDTVISESKLNLSHVTKTSQIEDTLDFTPGFDSTPDFQDRQNYLESAPQGVNAKYGWATPGGTGKGIKIIDIERGWIANHEDFNLPFWSSDSNLNLEHGSAVWGVVAGKNNGTGITGIAHESAFGFSGTVDSSGDGNYFSSAARAIELATTQLSAGDVLIIEQQTRGPISYVPAEYWELIFNAVKTASLKGIYVVAAGANGSSSLDDKANLGAFDIQVRDSGAVLVGAGAPPTSFNHLSRVWLSNFGNRIDAFGYGEDVTTTGFGDLYGTNPTNNYTARFSGTSSATAIVAGVVAALSGIAKAEGKLLTPLQMREALRKTGTQQKGNTNERIGNLPDISELHKYINR